MRGNAIHMGMKGIQHKMVVFPNHKGMIHILEPSFGFEISRVVGFGFKVFHKDVSYYWRQGEPIVVHSIRLYTVPLKNKKVYIRQICIRLRVSGSTS